MFVSAKEQREPSFLQDGNVIVDLGAMLLSNALRDPDNVAALLLLKAKVRVEDATVELLHERVHVELYFILEELVLESLLTRIVACALEECTVLLLGQIPMILSKK